MDDLPKGVDSAAWHVMNDMLADAPYFVHGSLGKLGGPYAPYMTIEKNSREFEIHFNGAAFLDAWNVAGNARYSVYPGLVVEYSDPDCFDIIMREIRGFFES